jgi:hypothetical protein
VECQLSDVLAVSSTGNKHQYSRNQLFISSPQKVKIPDPFQFFLIAYYFAMRMKLLIFEMEFFSGIL